jgi:hypothetical protein
MIRRINSPTSYLLGLWKNGWSSVKASLTYSQPDSQDDADWSAGAQSFANVEEMPTFIYQHRESAVQQLLTTSSDPQRLQGKQLQAYTFIREHAEAHHPPPLRLIVSGTAGTGKSYLIHCVRLLLHHHVRVAAPLTLQPSTLKVIPCTPSSASQSRETSKTCKENGYMRCSSHWQTWNTSSSMRCPWLEETFLDKLTSVYV